MIDKLIQKGQNENIAIEVFTNREYTVNLDYLNGIMDSYNTQDRTIYNIKATINNKTIKINTDVIDIDTIINLIKENANILDNNDLDLFTEENSIENKVNPPKDIDISKIKKDLIELDRLREEYKEIKSLEIDFNYMYESKKIKNSKTILQDTNGYFALFADISLEKEQNVKTRSASIYQKEYNIEEFKEKILENINLGTKYFSEESIKTNKYNIILLNNSVNKLLNKFYGMFYAESINKKTSPLVDKLQEKIFSDKITIVEDPTNEKYIGKSLFDNDGVKTYYKKIVENGKFITKLYDRKTALKENVSSTGNASGVRNAYLVPGKKSFKELIEQLKDGIIIENIEGLHAGLNTLTGDISLQATGFLVKNAKIEKALNMIILSTNIFELLNNVIEIGNDLEFFGEVSGAPSLLVSDITIVGKE